MSIGETSMKADFLRQLDELLQLPPGTLKGTEELASVPQWDSITVMGYIALISSERSKRVSGKEVMAAKTVGDLIALAGISE